MKPEDFKWVEVNDKLPLVNKRVLIRYKSDDDSRIDVDYIKEKNGVLYWNKYSSIILSGKVTHWGELPLEPKG